MKKSLLFICAATMVSLSSVAQNEILPGLSFKQVSPEGKFIVSDNDEGVVNVFSTDAHKVVLEIGDSESYDYFFVGYGNAITDSGLMVGDFGSQPTLFDVIKGTRTTLPVDKNLAQGGAAQAITPDGSIISGYLYTYLFQGIPNRIPVIWERQDDGTYSMPVVLPYPEKDLLGITPAAVEPYSISFDGTTIVAQVKDGFDHSIIWPIIIKKNSEGDWAYSEVAKHLINPKGIELPEYPGLSPDYPVASEFMTEEELAAYNKAWDDYFDGISDDMPDAEDFLGEEGKENYVAALDAYYEWDVKDAAFQKAYDEIASTSPNFWWNTSMSPNGRYITQFEGVTDYFYGAVVGKTYLFDTENDSVQIIDSMIASQVFDDSTILGYRKISAGTYIGQIRLSGESESMDLLDWIETKNQATSEWMEENMTHKVTDGYNETEVQMVVSGWPCAPLDMSYIATTVQQSWDWNAVDLGAPYSYILQINNEQSGINAVSDTSNLIDIYTLNGVAVRLKADKSAIETLPNGLYIVKDGENNYKLIK